MFEVKIAIGVLAMVLYVLAPGSHILLRCKQVLVANLAARKAVGSRKLWSGRPRGGAGASGAAGAGAAGTGAAGAGAAGAGAAEQQLALQALQA